MQETFIEFIELPTFAISTESPFKDLFPIQPNILSDIIEDMNENGFDECHPLVIWKNGNLTLIDGHTRLKAAIACGIDKVPVYCRDFENEEEALEYAIKEQANRRNLTDFELLQCIKQIDCRKKVGRPCSIEKGICGKSSHVTAKLLGISATKVERLRVINEYASDEIKEALSKGEYSIYRAYEETMKSRRRPIEFNNDGDYSLIYSVMSDIYSKLNVTQIRKLIKALQNEIN